MSPSAGAWILEHTHAHWAMIMALMRYDDGANGRRAASLRRHVERECCVERRSAACHEHWRSQRRGLMAYLGNWAGVPPSAHVAGRVPHGIMSVALDSFATHKLRSSTIHTILVAIPPPLKIVKRLVRPLQNHYSRTARVVEVKTTRPMPKSPPRRLHAQQRVISRLGWSAKSASNDLSIEGFCGPYTRCAEAQASRVRPTGTRKQQRAAR